MGDFPSAAEQEAAELQKKKDQAQERVTRREMLGQQPVPEPILDVDEE